MTSGVNLAEKSGGRVPKAVCRCTQPHSGNSCDVAGARLYWSCCSFGSITDRERERERERWGMLHGQQHVLHITLPRLTSAQSLTPTSTPEEDTPALLSSWTQHGEQQIPVIILHSTGIECGGRGCSRRWERSSDLTRQLSSASSWAAPSQKGAVPPRSAILIGCMGIKKNNPKSRLQP